LKTLFDQLVKSKLQTAFERYDAENPQVWEQFKEIAFDLIERGRKHYGAKAIFEVIRYHRATQTNDPDFKLNNNFTAFYARKFINLYPQYKDFSR